MKQNKEHIAFMEMLRRSDSTIFKICLMFTDRDPENVKDMYQDIVCSLWESWPRFMGQCKENTWVYSIAFNTAVSQVRHRSLSPITFHLSPYSRAAVFAAVVVMFLFLAVPVQNGRAMSNGSPSHRSAALTSVSFVLSHIQ